MRHISVLLVLLAGCSGRPDGSTPDPKGGLGEPVAKLSAVHFFNEYSDNPIRADEKYKGKPVQLTGEVGSISSDSIGFHKQEGFREMSMTTYDRLSDRAKKIFNEGYEPNVVCKLDPAFKSQFADAKKGKQLTLAGRVVGESKDPEAWQGRVVILEMCRPAAKP